MARPPQDPLHPQYNRKIVKFSIYLGYGDPGKAKLAVLRQYAIAKQTSLTRLILDALKSHFPDIGL